mmetsp:Transcript_22680/g.59273  ORF Transcript_22680/g.59273 Transcript_22680/m.59273 type:complete len:323 (+) Transcript_22680:143-1111(+)
MAMPMPPPMQALPTACWYDPAWCAKCAMIRAPDAPSGCPSAMAPPCMLKISSGIPNTFCTASACGAKASFTSTIPTASSESSAASSSVWTAGTGPMPITVGSTPTDEKPTRRARGASPCSPTAVSLARINEAAPSQMPDALAAVTVPAFLNDDGSFAIDSGVESGLGCSSTSKRVSPRRDLMVTGASSAAKAPSACPEAHRLCDCTPKASASSREMPCSSARFSAVMPIGRPQCESVSPAHSVSSRTGEVPSRVPHRIPRAANGACDIDSAPPANTTSVPRHCSISIAPVARAWKPEPQSRFTVRAGTAVRHPALSPMCLAM